MSKHSIMSWRYEKNYGNKQISLVFSTPYILGEFSLKGSSCYFKGLSVKSISVPVFRSWALLLAAAPLQLCLKATLELELERSWSQRKCPAPKHWYRNGFYLIRKVHPISVFSVFNCVIVWPIYLTFFNFLNRYIWVLRGTEPWYPIQNWPKTDTQTAPECNCIIVEFLFFGFLFPMV